jgi:Fe-S cluster assembly iron-binding protein IscA
MLQLSPDAVTTIAEFTGGRGLRFVAHETEGEIEFEPTVVDAPEPGDQVVESGGARVFLDTAAAEALDDQVLDIHEHGDHVHFNFSPQGEETPTAAEG